MRNVFIYKNPDTLQRARQFPLRFNIQKARHFTLHNFPWIFQVGIYIQKAWHFALREVFIYKNPDTSQKRKKICVTFIYKKTWTLCVTQFFVEFWNWRRGGHFYMQKAMYFASDLYMQKKALCVTFLYRTSLLLWVTFYMQKKCTLRYVIISKIYRIALIPNYERTYN